MIEQYAPLLSLFLIQGRTCSLCFLLSFICSWLSNKTNPVIINNPISLLLSMSTIFKKQLLQEICQADLTMMKFGSYTLPKEDPKNI